MGKQIVACLDLGQPFFVHARRRQLIVQRDEAEQMIFHAAARVIGTLALAIPLAVARRLPLPAGVLPLVVTAGVCEVLGFYSFTAAARHQIAVAAVLSSQFATLAAIGAYVLFGERLTRIQLYGVTSVIAGVALVSALSA